MQFHLGLWHRSEIAAEWEAEAGESQIQDHPGL